MNGEVALGRWWQYGLDAVLLECRDPEQRWLVVSPAARELVVGATTVLVRFDPRRQSAADVVASLSTGTAPGRTARQHEIDVHYDGADLASVAARAGLTCDDLVRRHTAATYRAEFCGFAPGFAYLSGLDPLLVAPRRDSPRPRVPAGSVAVAGPYCAVYPGASPGGWQLLGRTDDVLFDPAVSPPALIQPGDTVRFRAVSP